MQMYFNMQLYLYPQYELWLVWYRLKYPVWFYQNFRQILYHSSNVQWLILNFFYRRYFSLKKGVKLRYLEKVLFLLSKHNNKPSFLCLHIESIFTTSTSRWNGAYIHTYKPFKPFSTSTHLCNLIYMKFVTKQTCFFFHTFIKREKTHFCWFDLNL